MKLPPTFPDEVNVRYAFEVEGSRVFQLSHYFRFDSSYGMITVPTGFFTDGASIPRIFWPVFDPFGRYFPAAIVHDWLYSRAAAKLGYTRGEADEIFLEAMTDLGVGWLTRKTIYAAVRIGGWASYQKK